MWTFGIDRFSFQKFEFEHFGKCSKPFCDWHDSVASHHRIIWQTGVADKVDTILKLAGRQAHE